MEPSSAVWLVWFPIWIGVALVIRAVRRDRFQLLLGHAVLGMSFYAVSLVGGWLWGHTDPPFGFRMTTGVAIWIIGTSAWWGWMLSPGGVELSLTPVYWLTGLRTKDGGAKGDRGERLPYWGRWATGAAAFQFVLMTAMWVWIYRTAYLPLHLR